MAAIRLQYRKVYRQVPIFRFVPLSLGCYSGLRGPILKEPQCEKIGKQIESTSNTEH